MNHAIIIQYGAVSLVPESIATLKGLQRPFIDDLATFKGEFGRLGLDHASRYIGGVSCVAVRLPDTAKPPAEIIRDYWVDRMACLLRRFDGGQLVHVLDHNYPTWKNDCAGDKRQTDTVRSIAMRYLDFNDDGLILDVLHLAGYRV